MSLQHKLVLGGLVLAFFFGTAIGSAVNAAEPGPAPKVVTVPKYIVKYKTKTTTTYAGLPDSCRTAADLIMAVTDESGTVTAATGKLLTALDKMGSATAFNDVNSINKATEVVRKQMDIIENNVLNDTEDAKAVQSAIATCNAETQEINP